MSKRHDLESEVSRLKRECDILRVDAELTNAVVMNLRLMGIDIPMDALRRAISGCGMRLDRPERVSFDDRNWYAHGWKK